MPRPVPTKLYHFTAVEHLPTIIERGLLCDAHVHRNSVLTTEVGNTDIKQRRRDCPVTVRPYGVPADYVPFYFAPRSPMLYSIHRGNVPSYAGDTKQLAYLVTSVERLNELKLGSYCRTVRVETRPGWYF